MENSLFRKSALERITAPEQLNDYLRIINPGIWLVLSGFFVIVLAVGVWACTGSIPDTAKFKGIAYSQSGDLSIYAYIPLNDAVRLTDGMQVQISPEYAPREEYGYILGEIRSVDKQLIGERELLRRYGDIDFLRGLLPQGNFVEVIVALNRQNGKLQWSSKKGADITLEKGAYCNALVIIKERKPYELVF